MKIFIYGANDMGYLIASQFYEKNDIIVIDKEENKIDEFNKLDVSFINSTIIDSETLKDFGISTKDAFIACSNLDETNVIACLAAKKITNIKTICFVTKHDYRFSSMLSKDNENLFDLYIDHIIWPEELLTNEIFRILTVAKALDVEHFADGKASLLEYKIEPNSVLVNKKVKDCNFPEHTLIVGIVRDSKLFIPYGETILNQDDKVLFMGLSHSLDTLAGRFFHETDYSQDMTIIGGGNVGFMLAKKLEDLKINVKIIERDIKRCDELSQILKKALIINGDGTNLEILNEENIENSDAVISITNNDEKNLLCSLLAKQLGVKRVLSRVSKPLNIPLFEKVGIDIALSAKSVALHEIKNCLFESSVDILATVEQGKGEILEIIAPKFLDQTMLMQLNLSARALITTIRRGNKVIIPKGNTLIREGDELIIFTMQENVSSIKQFFKVV